MVSTQKREIPWADIGEPLANLLRYERQIGHYEHAGYALLSAVVHDAESSVWRRFLLAGDNFAAVVRQVIAISDRESKTPKTVLDSIRGLVDTAYVHAPKGAGQFLKTYLKRRPSFPDPIRGELDALAMRGKRRIVLRAAAFAAEMERVQPFRPDGKVAEVVSEHWYERILQGSITAHQVRGIPARLLTAKERLLNHLREVEGDSQIDEKAVFEGYAGVFQSTDILGLTDVIVNMPRFNLIHGFHVEFGVGEVELFLKNFPTVEVLNRFEKLEGWLGKYHKTNHDGTILTPPLINFLSQRADFDSLLFELDRYRADTRNGRFDVTNILQRDLEFRRFVYEYTRVLEPLTYQLQNRYPPPKSHKELYRLFDQLEELPPVAVDESGLSEQHLAEVGRTAYEAVEFLKFLRGFRARTSRHIVVVGNDRYGRQWVVEPLEAYLKEGFTLRYDRVRSGTSTRLSVPSAFPREFVKEISEQMPHIVVVDASHAPPDNDVMQLSRGLRSYAHWFAAFNDLRAEGDITRYRAESSLPAEHFPELMKWHDYVARREQLREWVSPGQTYRVTTWAPELRDTVILGDMRVKRYPPVSHEEIGGNLPMVILANPIIYRTEGDDLPDALRGTTPRHFDDPEAHAVDSIVFGFGAHGLETRLEGMSTEQFVQIAQGHIKEEIDRLLAES